MEEEQRSRIVTDTDRDSIAIQDFEVTSQDKKDNSTQRVGEGRTREPYYIEGVSHWLQDFEQSFLAAQPLVRLNPDGE